MTIQQDTQIANWDALRDKFKMRWPSLTQAELDDIHGSRENLVALVQLHGGFTTEKAEADVDEFLDLIGASTN